MACRETAPGEARIAAPCPWGHELDAFKPQILRWLDAHPNSAQQFVQRLGEAGFEGGISIVMDHVLRIRPRHLEAFLELDFAPASAPRSTGASGAPSAWDRTAGA